MAITTSKGGSQCKPRKVKDRAAEFRTQERDDIGLVVDRLAVGVAAPVARAATRAHVDLRGWRKQAHSRRHLIRVGGGNALIVIGGEQQQWRILDAALDIVKRRVGDEPFEVL